MTLQLSLLFLQQKKKILCTFVRQINEGGFYFSSHLTKPLHIFTSDITDNINHLSDFNREEKRREEKRREEKRREEKRREEKRREEKRREEKRREEKRREIETRHRE